MASNFLDTIGFQKPKSEQEQFLELMAPNGVPRLVKKKVKPAAVVEREQLNGAIRESQKLGTQLRPDGASAYYGPGGDPAGTGRGQAQMSSNMIGLMGPDGRPFDPSKYKPSESNKTSENITSRDVTRGSAKGTQTSPAPAKFDGTEGMDAFIAKLQKAPYGITFGGQGGRTSMESTNLPDTSTGKMVSITNGKNAGKYVDVNNPDFDAIVRGDKEGGVSGEQTSGGGAKGGLTAALADTDGMRSYMKRVTEAEAPEGDDGYGPGYATDGLDARSRAFLDYDGKGGTMMALRAADAAQKTVYAGGKLYDVSAKNDEGKYNVVNDEGREFLRQNRNATTDAQAYKDAYQKGIVVPEDAKSEDSKNPEMSSRPTYIQQSQRDMEGTLVMGPDDKPEPFENNVNRSFITGSPGQDIYNTTNNPFVDKQEPPTTGFLPDEEVEEEIKKLYLQ